MPFETLVALEASTRRASLALHVGERRSIRSLEPGKAHATDLLPCLAQMMEELGTQPAQLDGVVVATGPGSFTGLRVAIATALGLCRGTGAAVIGIPSFEALVYGELEAEESATVLTNAFGGELYHARYRRTLDEVETLVAPRIESARAGGSLELVGDTLLLTETALVETLGLDIEPERLRTDWDVTATALLELGKLRLERGLAVGLDALEPLYLRPFAARRAKR